MRIRYKVVDLALVVVEERVEVLLVEEGGALRAGQDQVQVDEEAEPGIKRNPGQDEGECVFDGGDERQGHEVHEPWSEERGVRCVERFVGCEDGEEDGCRDAGQSVSYASSGGVSSRVIGSLLQLS